MDQKKALEIVKEASEMCAAAFGCPVQDAILYGSYAWGGYTPESDVNILLTVPLDTEEVNRRRYRVIGRIGSDLSLKHDVTVSPDVESVDWFRYLVRMSPKFREIAEEGIRCVEQGAA